MPDADPLEIHGPELEGRLDRAGHDFILVDVRETYELGRGVLPGAVNLPMSELEQREAELGAGSDIIVYCEHGVRSYNVAAWLEARGRRARSLAGGFAEWTGPRSPFEP